MADTEPKYTLAEAQRVLALRECAENGHDWIDIRSYEVPVAVVCTRCGWNGRIVMDPKPTN